VTTLTYQSHVWTENVGNIITQVI